MSNETKRDVFNKVADECAGLDYEMYKEYLKRYDAALPDDLPVIPKAIGEYITSCKANNMDLHDTMFNWLRSDEEDEFMDDNSDTFALAWVLGIWKVEETGEIVKLEAEK
ncbi:DUF1642 domain-containing protein [Lacticaseibacillus rhamnosus]|uniref:DUF1642 domain-containing protein n=1 Tax=Lacticaseibacillus rhamnosus TaxID=47715 RepID=UPI000532B9EF|nr:DUF1642 domain-containing protein [Lacticaseibacillus rhamnosus]